MNLRILLACCLCLGCVLQLDAADTNAPDAPYILTPPAPHTPRINGPDIFGVRPGSPFLYTIPATGDRPMTFSVNNLPRGLKVNAKTGRITGSFPKARPAPADAKGAYFLSHSRPALGTCAVTLVAKNALGTAEKKFRIVVGNQIALTPPMGWNSWNCFAGSVSEAKVKREAEAMVKSGLVNYGWTYINVDDYWQNHRHPTIPALRGPFRDKHGNIVPNSRFPDMKGLANYIHSLGLKAGLYSSPGPWTCGGCEGSYGHEAQDAATYAKWGFDYLKYDWCSYGQTDTNRTWPTARQKAGYSLAFLKKPYALMGKLLREQDRDIVFSLCQYGMGDVWKWGGLVGGNSWRTTGDIRDNWGSVSKIGFHQGMAAPYAKPGNWNDPDMLVVGEVGWGHLHPTHLTPNEQYSHISLWCLLSAPLLIGCDMTRLDPFTLNLLENNEVLALDQDALGKEATCVVTNGNVRVYEKELEDGGHALGFFNLGSQPAHLEFNQLAQLGFHGEQHVRDLWRQKNLPDVDADGGVLKMTIPVHGVMLYKLTTVK